MPEEYTIKSGEVNLLIALPCYGGQTYLAHNRSMRLLIARLIQLGIRHQILELGTESLIPRGRNAFANICCFDKDPADQFYTHLLFLDVDIGFNPENIVQAIAINKDIVALPYPCKMINWTYILDAAKQGVDDPNVLCRMGSRPIVNTNDKPIVFNTSQPVQFPQLGTGVLLIKREVLQKFAEDPARRYRLMEGERNGLARDFAIDFFQIGINPESRYYDSEDYRFSIDARKLGFETWLLPWAVTSHTGSYDFFMDIQAQAANGIPKADQTSPRPGFVPMTI